MNSRSIWIWLAIAAVLFAFIFGIERRLNLEPAGPPAVLPGFDPNAVENIQVQARGERAIRVVRTNGGWRMSDPVDYPASARPINAFLDALKSLTATPYLSPGELKDMADADHRFGFDAPQYSLMLNQRQRLILVGNKTPPGDRVYVQVVGVAGVFVVDADLLRLIPHTPGLWRDTALADWSQLQFDRVVVTNAGKLLELQLDPTNQLWRMLSPNNVRANTAKVNETLQLLAGARAQDFVTDDPAADLEALGLQNPELSLALFNGTNAALRLDFGRSPTNNPAVIYARRASQSTVVAVSRTFVEPWTSAHSQAFRGFFDPHLVALARMPSEVEIQADDRFRLVRSNDLWRVEPPGWAADSNLVAQLFSNVTNLQVTADQIEKDIVPAADLPKYGLAQPFRQYVFRDATDVNGIQTNIVLAQLEFGTNQDKVFAREPAQSFVYVIDPAILQLLPVASWQMRDRRIWQFSIADVERVTVEQGSRQRQFVRKADRKWTLGEGTQGLVDELVSAQLEETVTRLGDLSAAYWAGRGADNLEKHGIKPGSHRLTVELKSGARHIVTFGDLAPSQFPYAAVELGGDAWIFEFPWTTYQFVQLYLSIPDAP